MSEPTKKEMLEELGFMEESRLGEIGDKWHRYKDENLKAIYFNAQERVKKICQAIRQLIEQGEPKVTKDEIYGAIFHPPKVLVDRIIKLLEKKGMEVSDEEEMSDE
jgi:hypothetical protein